MWVQSIIYNQSMTQIESHDLSHDIFQPIKSVIYAGSCFLTVKTKSQSSSVTHGTEEHAKRERNWFWLKLKIGCYERWGKGERWQCTGDFVTDRYLTHLWRVHASLSIRRWKLFNLTKMNGSGLLHFSQKWIQKLNSLFSCLIMQYL